MVQSSVNAMINVLGRNESWLSKKGSAHQDISGMNSDLCALVKNRREFFWVALQVQEKTYGW
jgi:hypothetical protein